MSLSSSVSVPISFPAKKISKMVIIAFYMLDIKLVSLKVLLPSMSAFIFTSTWELVENISFNITIASPDKESNW